jgi:multiple sugar transport system substrate-binding protein
MSIRQFRNTLFAGAAALIASGSGALSQEVLTVWANKGFYKAEDDALLAVVDKFQKATGIKIELSLTSIEDCITKSVGAVEAGTPPDVGYCLTYDFRTTGKWAFEGRLADLSSVVEGMKADFVPEALATTLLYNDKAKKRAYYAVPVQRQTIHIQYWRDMLEEAGFKESDIPKAWDAYWDFWCSKVQAGLRAKGKRVFGIGNPLGVASTDTFFSFLMHAAAYDAKIVDENGKVVLDQPQNRANMVKAMKHYTDLHAKGCTPPGSVNWQDPDNNVAFHNKQIVMTHNATISIAAKWLDDMNNTSLTQAQRDEAKKNYEERIATAGYPMRPDGKPVTYLAATKTAVVFDQAKNKNRALEFIAFLMKDENLRPFVEGSLGRWYPATTAATKSPFWTSGDKHRKVVHDQFTAGTVPFQFVQNFRFTQVNAENVWAKAMQRIIQDKVTPEVAVDEMIKRIKEIAG